MFSAPSAGRTCAMWATRPSIGPAPPVEKFRMTGQRCAISRAIAAYTSGAYVGPPSSVRAWMCTTAAPASYARAASSAISAGVYGTHGHCSRVARTPGSAQVTITLSVLISASLEVGLALLAKCRDPLGGVRGACAHPEESAHRLHLRLVGHVLRRVESAAAQPQRCRALRGERLQQLG